MNFTEWLQSVRVFVSCANAHQKAPTAEEALNNSRKIDLNHEYVNQGLS